MPCLPLFIKRLDFIEPPQSPTVTTPTPRSTLWVPSSAHPRRSGSFSVLGPHAPATCLRFDAGRQVLVSGHADNTVRIWAVRSDQFEPVFTLYGHTGAVTCLEFDGFKIVSGSRDRTIKVRTTSGTHGSDQLANANLCTSFFLPVATDLVYGYGRVRDNFAGPHSGRGRACFRRAPHLLRGRGRCR